MVFFALDADFKSLVKGGRTFPMPGILRTPRRSIKSITAYVCCDDDALLLMLLMLLLLLLLLMMMMMKSWESVFVVSFRLLLETRDHWAAIRVYW